MIRAIRDAITQWLHTNGTPQRSELGLLDDWRSVTFRSDVLRQEFDSEKLHAAPFTTYYIAPSVPVRQQIGQRAFQRLRSEQSREKLANEDVEQLSELAPRQHCMFERDPIEWWYQRRSEGDSTAREKVEAFESIITSYPGEKVISCGGLTHDDRIVQLFSEGTRGE